MLVNVNNRSLKQRLIYEIIVFAFANNKLRLKVTNFFNVQVGSKIFMERKWEHTIYFSPPPPALDVPGSKHCLSGEYLICLL